MGSTAISTTPLESLREGGVNVDSFTPDVRSALATLSAEEVSVLLEVRRKFAEGGVLELQDAAGNQIF